MYISAYSREPRAQQGPSSRFNTKAREAVYSHLQKTTSIIPITSQSDNQSLYTSLSRCSTQSSSNSSSQSCFSGNSVEIAAGILSGDGSAYSQALVLSLEQVLRDIESMNSIYPQRCLGIDIPASPLDSPFPDWDLNLQRTQLFVSALPAQWQGQTPLIQSKVYTKESGTRHHRRFQLILVPYQITDHELIQLFALSRLYSEHKLDTQFKHHVAEVSVKKSRLLQLSQRAKNLPTSASLDIPLSFELKCIALRNYVINLGCAAQTSIEFKHACKVIKQDRYAQMCHADPSTTNHEANLTKEEKKVLWNTIRTDVFQRAGFDGE
ncbi:hypothetical protein BABINDRAFT_169485 [Babjeviella inositovora NRRL Y-12698]|uniref:Uncharacterized protein n=1 Tax=Babjeviella inositovora NRRL Y-12698 TaxID=984486 RepID=A0A1E3QI77_9ASCO|nr:uncharacterized protein BABINDRAFT_169485 [Babjeviella inositovora NRRL Y-12698]ODQ77144.1 hypothetical protein BABINDRAFT_169485 [Babjeviella inositovora NRRL Y-12698]